MATEGDLISAIAAIFANPRPDIRLGIGDDGAVIRVAAQNQIAVADMAVEGTHFRRDWSGLFDIGAKVAAANFADIYAMGGVPSYILVTAALPHNISVAEVRELAQGIRSECDLVGAVAIGGDLSRSANIVLSITAIGTSALPITRSGAQVGDQIIISDLPGWSAAGLSLLQSGSSLTSPPALRARESHRKPVVRYDKARSMAEAGIHSLIDVSDGLVSELGHLSKSSAIKFRIESKLLEAIPEFQQLAALALQLEIDVWEWILGGGEDHAFLGTKKVETQLPDGVWVIGSTTSGQGVEIEGTSLPQSGFHHFT
ncbi:MAG: thiamine-phosphate kinase [Actinomycetes bacterium]